MKSDLAKRNTKQSGFTLIELVIVIVILGVLSAFALPRFADLGGDARNASREGMIGSVKSASSIAHSKCLASSSCEETGDSSQSPLETATLDGEDIDMVLGYPDSTSDGIGAAAQLDDATVNSESSGSAITYYVEGSSDCAFTYNAATSSNPSPSISTSGSCE